MHPAGFETPPEDVYLPALDSVESDIKEAIKFAEKGFSEQTNAINKKTLHANIKSKGNFLPIIMQGTNTAVPPRLKDFRAIALAT